MLRWKPAKNTHLLYVNSVFSPVSALPDRLSLRFNTLLSKPRRACRHNQCVGAFTIHAGKLY